jgi:hypothetical protein
MNSPALTDPSMTLPLNVALHLSGQAPAAAVPAWLTGERTLVLSVALVASCAAVVLCLHG